MLTQELVCTNELTRCHFTKDLFSTYQTYSQYTWMTSCILNSIEVSEETIKFNLSFTKKYKTQKMQGSVIFANSFLVWLSWDAEVFSSLERNKGGRGGGWVERTNEERKREWRSEDEAERNARNPKVFLFLSPLHSFGEDGMMGQTDRHTCSWWKIPLLSDNVSLRRQN